MHMLAAVANLTNSGAVLKKKSIPSVDVMQQSVSAVKTLSSNTDGYDPVTFLDTINMTRIVDNMEDSVSHLTEEVRSDKTINSYTYVSITLQIGKPPKYVICQLGKLTDLVIHLCGVGKLRTSFGW